MIDRAQRILLMLMEQGGPLTSAQLAERVGVSSRTIKNAMGQVAKILAENGAELNSRRNRGYDIVVHDQQRYQELLDRISTHAVHIAMAGYDNTTRVLHICRKLVAAPAGAKIEEICEDLCLSRSAVRKPLRQARAFCESFHLKITSSPSGGIRVFGEERMMRLAMVEFFEVHFHKFQLDDSDREYARWIGCDYQERQDIRHCFLKALRESGVSMRDSATQRMSMYFIIARNRVRAGLDIILPEAWIAEIQQTPFYEVARVIVDSLNDQFEGFEFSRHEIAFLGMWIMQNHDVNCRVDLKALVPFLYPQVAKAAAEVLALVARRTGLNFAEVPGARGLLEQIIMPILAGHRYDMDGFRRFDYETERISLKSPLAVYLGNEFIHALGEVTGCAYSLSDTLLLAAMVLGIVEQVAFPLKPLRLLITCGMGPEYARIEGAMLQQRFPELIQSVHACELYEIRGYDERLYDAVIADVGTFGYNYSYPLANMGIVRAESDIGKVHDTVLINAYDTDDLLIDEDAIHVRTSLRLETVDQFIALLKLEHEGDEAIARALDIVSASKDQPLESTPAAVQEGVLFLVAPLVKRDGREPGRDQGEDAARAGADRWESTDGHEGERLDYYRFLTPLRWGDERISSAFFCVLDFSRGMQRLKAMERVLYVLAMKAGDLAPFVAQPLPFIRAALRNSLKLFPEI